jgi:cold shock CspA family protein
VLTGTVIEFDGAKGLGTVRGENGVDYLFHVIEITDGTRTIDLGERVRYQPLPKFGRFQAGRIHKV